MRIDKDMLKFSNFTSVGERFLPENSKKERESYLQLRFDIKIELPSSGAN